jgi:XTP/dITP diphosphohydrolase
MARTLETGGTLIVASHNQGKVREIRDLLAPFGITVQSAADLNLPEPEETEDSFIGNAKLKALAAAQAANLPALSDDSGLAVTALGGAPGIYSARWAGPSKDFTAAMERVHSELGDGADRSAAFVCALCLAWPDGHSETFEGRVEGSIVWPMRGERGFGYDPVFVPDGHSVTFAEMDPAEKHSMSHRARAFAQMVEACF